LSPLALILILASTFMHAGGNLRVRRYKAEAPRVLVRMLAVIAVAGALPMVASEWQVRSLPAQAWLFVLASGCCCGVYSFALARGYQSADFTVVYPVTRALPVILVGLGEVMLGRAFGVIGWSGILLVTVGCLLAPLHSLKEFAWRAYLHRSMFWMCLAALGTVGYTLLDKASADIVLIKGAGTAARYGYLFFLVSFLSYAALCRLFGCTQPGEGRMGWGIPALGAVLCFGAYWLVLWALQLSRQASYVIAFRQFSVVLGVMLAFALFREKGMVIRTIAALVITLGLLIIGLWG